MLNKFTSVKLIKTTFMNNRGLNNMKSIFKKLTYILIATSIVVLSNTSQINAMSQSPNKKQKTTHEANSIPDIEILNPQDPEIKKIAFQKGFTPKQLKSLIQKYIKTLEV